mgnify:CR=1 FL=1
MKHLKLLIIISLLVSCGQLGLQNRKAIKPKTLEMVQEAANSDEELVRVTQLKLYDLHYLHLSAYSELENFDQSLEKDWQGLANSLPYSKLLAIRIQAEEHEEELHHVQQDLLAQAQDEALPVAERLKALVSMEKTLPTPEQVQGAWLYTLWRQHHRNKVLARHLMLAQGKVQEVAVQVSMEKVYLTLKNRYGAFNEHDHNFANWKQLIQKEQLKVKSHETVERIAKSIEHAAHELRFERQKLRQEMKAQDSANKTFLPSTSSNGNVTGDEFPHKVWSLTFNDGPIPSLSNQLVDQVMAHGQQATFFQLSQLALKYPRTAKYVRNAGMEIAAHGEEHTSLLRASGEERDLHIRQASADLSELHGATPIRFYRLPYGAGLGVRELRARIANANMLHASWNVDAIDWQAQPASDISQRVIKQMNKTSHEAGVVSFHESSELTVAAVRDVLQHMKARNHRSCALGDIVDQMNRKNAVCPVKIDLSSN